MAFSVECAKGIARRNVVKRWQNVRDGGRYDLPIQLVRFLVRAIFTKDWSTMSGQNYQYYGGKFFHIIQGNLTTNYGRFVLKGDSGKTPTYLAPIYRIPRFTRIYSFPLEARSIWLLLYLLLLSRD